MIDTPEAISARVRSMSETERMLAVNAAYGRIQVGEDGRDYLDGCPLPPENDEPWQSEHGGLVTYHAEVDDLTPLLTGYRERDAGPVTNRLAREADIHSLALFGHPTYITWDDWDKFGDEHWGHWPEHTEGKRPRFLRGLQGFLALFDDDRMI
jgi:hypothetical protein